MTKLVIAFHWLGLRSSVSFCGAQKALLPSAGRKYTCTQITRDIFLDFRFFGKYRTWAKYKFWLYTHKLSNRILTCKICNNIHVFNALSIWANQLPFQDASHPYVPVSVEHMLTCSGLLHHGHDKSTLSWLPACVRYSVYFTEEGVRLGSTGAPKWYQTPTVKATIHSICKNR